MQVAGASLIAFALIVFALLVARAVVRHRARQFDFDVAVIGAGAAGLTAAGMAASLGARTLLVEQAKLGGDCTWTGCVPSKTLLRAARLAHERRHGSRYGLCDELLDVDFAKLMEHVRSLREGIYEHADAPHLFEAMGIEVRSGRARFRDPHTLVVTHADGTQSEVRARFVVVATGGRPRVPAIEGIDSVNYLTHESLFELPELPQRLLVVGAGPIGCEMAQAFGRLGAEVVLAQRGREILPHDDAELARELRGVLESEGVDCRLDAEVIRVVAAAEELRATLRVHGGEHEVRCDALLLAAGRRPDLDELNLPAAGVEYGERGVVVDLGCRTSAANVYACGDATGLYQFTHMAEHMSKIAMTRIMLHLPARIDLRHVPWCTFTDPELAAIGRSAEQLRAANVAFEEYRFPFSKLDRAITDGTAIGWVKVFATRTSGTILGACVLGTGAGDLIGELAVAMRNGVSLRQIADTIHPYPTLGLGVRRAADQWYVRKRSRRVVRLLQWCFGTRGVLRDFDPDEIV